MDLPPVSDESDLTLQEGDVVRNIQVTIVCMTDGMNNLLVIPEKRSGFLDPAPKS